MTGGNGVFRAGLCKGQGKIQIISAVFYVNKTLQTTWKDEINLHKESEEILWSQKEVRQLPSDFFLNYFNFKSTNKNMVKRWLNITCKGMQWSKGHCTQSIKE